MTRPSKLEEQLAHLHQVHERQTAQVNELTRAETHAANRYEKFTRLVELNEQSQKELTRDRIAVENVVASWVHGTGAAPPSLSSPLSAQPYLASMAYNREHAAMLDRTLRKLRRLQAAYLAVYNQARKVKQAAALTLQRYEHAITGLRERQHLNKMRAIQRADAKRKATK